MTTSIEKKLSLARAGLIPINISLYLGNHIANSHNILKLALTGAWAASLNLSRKGDATKLETLGTRIFGEAEFETAINEALKLGAKGHKLEIVKAGFARIEIEAFMGDQTDVEGDREVLEKMLVGVWGALVHCRKMGEAQEVEEMGVWIFGEEGWKKGVRGMLEEFV
ncbi:uncharacterized protein MYCFIDRAFT_198764 [Pseudocercospora fijiensis CIRAD86]|uniref:Uncharacterized protein n=1 Tax=Pseudocercospora fijiensis (strain CIRAD86) TaxID=383855 RepID=M3ASV9_PSEFD|nr:uncharacterized protein MYCFIDRAFT_198764 [Pseudocercospora fijiensis CIRAD86]EME80577.1 hypothetical protein MYCFIDRAFT_198764 [Pseudocercospora fijiensis CIRAD86]